MLSVGVDAGSRTIKVVMIDGQDLRIRGSGIVDQGVDQARRTKNLFHQVLNEAGSSKDDVARIVATGYGRNALNWADTRVTEITCQAVGVKHQCPDVRTIIDIGGQDSKMIHLDSKGAIYDFAMNDRCAAGTGRFLEILADRLNVKLQDLDRMSRKADKPAAINSMCAVFAETEIVGLLASGESPENIIAGVQNALVQRVGAMAGGKMESPVALTGGVALIPRIHDALATALNHAVIAVDRPQISCAFGAAIIAVKQFSGSFGLDSPRSYSHPKMVEVIP